MITKTFDQWDTDDLSLVFGLERSRHSPNFDAWLQAASTAEEFCSQAERESLELLRDELADSVDLWNEDELKFRFIAPLIHLVRYTTKYASVFTQRSLSAFVSGIELTGRVDFLVASGRAKPIKPYFFLHEYKKEFAGANDPRAQLVVAMLAARALNNIPYPIYGCYVVGRNWFFVVLEEAIYAESLAFDATQDDIFQIFAILRRAKTIIAEIAEKYAAH